MELKKKKDLVGIIAMLGRKTKQLFNSEAKVELASLLSPVHDESFGVVYANTVAESEIEKDRPRFAEGAIVVRERLRSANADSPESVIAMIKRNRGFSRKTDDWEFFAFDRNLKLTKRETKGDCAACHAKQEDTDWLYRGYLTK